MHKYRAMRCPRLAAWLCSTTAVEMAPGPDSIGIASGVTAMSVFATPAAVSSEVSCTRERCARNMSSATSSSTMLAASWKAGIVMPRNLNIHFPASGEGQQHSHRDVTGQPRHLDALFRRVGRRHGQKGRHRSQRVHNHEQGAGGQEDVFGQAHIEQGAKIASVMP